MPLEQPDWPKFDVPTPFGTLELTVTRANAAHLRGECVINRIPHKLSCHLVSRLLEGKPGWRIEYLDADRTDKPTRYGYETTSNIRSRPYDELPEITARFLALHPEAHRQADLMVKRSELEGKRANIRDHQKRIEELNLEVAHLESVIRVLEQAEAKPAAASLFPEPPPEF